MHKEYTYKIGQDADGQEYCYDPEYEGYAKPGSDNYSWWARKYASGADNYPWSCDDDAADDYGSSNPWDAPDMGTSDFI